jgi:hypothetical protein
MLFKAIFTSIGCMIAWFLLMPIFVFGGGATVLLYALTLEISSLLTGRGKKSPDPIAAREMARRICLGLPNERVVASRALVD